MKCMHCQGEMTKGIAPFHIDRKGYHLTLDKIPAWICNQCGELFFDENEVEAIQEILYAVEDKTEKISKAA